MRQELKRALGLFVLLGFTIPAAFAEEQDRSEPPPYANTPTEAVPFRKFVKPYHIFFQEPTEFLGSGRRKAPPEVKEVRLGLFGPLEDHPERVFGLQMKKGALLALEQANARGGYDGLPFVLREHNDQALWGASSNELVKMEEEGVWAILGSVDASSTHILLRATLKLEIPIVNTATSEPSLTETRIPWIIRNFIDDRQQGYALADYVYRKLGLWRVGILRVNARYGRLGVVEFVDAARRLGRPVVLQTKYNRGDRDFSKQLRMLEAAKVDGILLWGEAPEAGLILKQMRQAGMKQPVFGGDRLVSEELLRIGGAAAEGFVASFTYDPNRAEPRLIAFREAFRKRFDEEPTHFAVHAFDGMNLLIDAVRKAGLNRTRIRDVLADYRFYDGVGGKVIFDPTHNNIARPTLAVVQDGRFVFRSSYENAGELQAHHEQATSQ